MSPPGGNGTGVAWLAHREWVGGGRFHCPREFTATASTPGTSGWGFASQGEENARGRAGPCLRALGWRWASCRPSVPSQCRLTWNERPRWWSPPPMREGSSGVLAARVEEGPADPGATPRDLDALSPNDGRGQPHPRAALRHQTTTQPGMRAARIRAHQKSSHLDSAFTPPPSSFIPRLPFPVPHSPLPALARPAHGPHGAPALHKISGTPSTPGAPPDFIRDIVGTDVAAGSYRLVVSWFPPEPNGYRVSPPNGRRHVMRLRRPAVAEAPSPSAKPAARPTSRQQPPS